MATYTLRILDVKQLACIKETKPLFWLYFILCVDVTVFECFFKRLIYADKNRDKQMVKARCTK